MNYKDIFRLAQNKSYKFRIANWFSKAYEDFNFSNPDDIQLDAELFAELSLIQKWLRDIYKIIVIVRPMNRDNMTFFCSILAMIQDRDFTTGLDNTYEYALLTGVNEALQLI